MTHPGYPPQVRALIFEKSLSVYAKIWLVLLFQILSSVSLIKSIFQGELISEAVSICKKCISPKPPRTHHCSVCNRCILKMDHHCRMLEIY